MLVYITTSVHGSAFNFLDLYVSKNSREPRELKNNSVDLYAETN